MRYCESEEMYLETILLLEQKNGYVRRVDIAGELGYKKPSVTRAIKHLREKEYIWEDDLGSIHLTEAGRNMATYVYEKHHLITKLLIKIGVDPSVAEENACRIEHVISSDLMDAIRKYMNETTVCG